MKPTLRLNFAQPLSASRAKSIAFIGCGQMGKGMAHNLFSKSDPSTTLVVHDYSLDAARLFRTNFLAKYPDRRVEIALSPEEAVRSSQTIVSMLPASNEVKSVYLGAGGIMAGLHSLTREEIENSLFLDSTTLHIEVAQQVASQINSTGASMLDTPVSGGAVGANDGTLAFMVGGQEVVYNRATTHLSKMGTKLLYCGPSGSGLGAKICNNLILGVEQIVVGEAMLLGQSFGLDPKVLAAVVNSSTGACWSSSVNNPVPHALPDKNPPSNRNYEGGFATVLMLKDMGLATSSALALNSPLPMATAAEKIYQDVVNTVPSFARKDFSSVYEYLRDHSKKSEDSTV